MVARYRYNGKEKGVRKKHTLLFIELPEAGFNLVLEMFFAKDLMKIAGENLALAEE